MKKNRSIEKSIVANQQTSWYKPVTIRVKTSGWNVGDGKPNVNTLITEGTLSYDKLYGIWHLNYSEGVDSLGQNCEVRVVIYSNGQIGIYRTGSRIFDMQFGQGNEIVTHRRTDLGVERLSVFVHNSNANLDQQGGQIRIDYSARINSDFKMAMSIEYEITTDRNLWHKVLSN